MKETTTKGLTKMREIGWWLHVDADEYKRCTYSDGCVGMQTWLVAWMSVEKNKQNKISGLHMDAARDADALCAMLHGYAGVDVDGCRCRCGADADVVWMRMWCGCGYGVDVDGMWMLWMWMSEKKKEKIHTVRMWMWYRCRCGMDADGMWMWMGCGCL